MFNRSIYTIQFADVTDGLSNTLMLGETLPAHSILNGAYYTNYPMSGTTIPLNHMEADREARWYRTYGFKSLHAGGAQFCLGDGSVHFVSESIDYRLYNALGTLAGGEVGGLP